MVILAVFGEVLQEELLDALCRQGLHRFVPRRETGEGRDALPYLGRVGVHVHKGMPDAGVGEDLPPAPRLLE